MGKWVVSKGIFWVGLEEVESGMEVFVGVVGRWVEGSCVVVEDVVEFMGVVLSLGVVGGVVEDVRKMMGKVVRMRRYLVVGGLIWLKWKIVRKVGNIVVLELMLLDLKRLVWVGCGRIIGWDEGGVKEVEMNSGGWRIVVVIVRVIGWRRNKRGLGVRLGECEKIVEGVNKVFGGGVRVDGLGMDVDE